MNKLLITCLSFILLAIQVQTAAQEMKPDAAGFYNTGNKLLRAGNYEAAINNYKQAVHLMNDYRIFYQIGVAFKLSGKLDSAKIYFKNCLSMKPEFEDGLTGLAGVYFSMGKYPEAANYFEKELAVAKNQSKKDKIKKDLSLTYVKFAENFLKGGDTAKVIIALKKAVIFYKYDIAYLILARTYFDLGEYNKSISAAAEAVKYKTTIGTGGPYYYMGVAYKEKNNNSKAKEMFGMAMNDPEYKNIARYELFRLDSLEK